MNRISFLRRLLASLFGVAALKHAHASDSPTDQENPVSDPANGFGKPGHPRYLLSTTVAGKYYYDFPTRGPKLLGEYEDLYTSIHSNYSEHAAELRLEPDNEFDYKAIEVYCYGHKMGYIPRRHNKVLYNLLKDGAKLEAKVRLHVQDPIEPDILYTYEFEQMYDMRIRVYLLAEAIAI